MRSITPTVKSLLVALVALSLVGCATLERRKGTTLAALGAKAADFKLPDADGGEVSLAELLASGPVIVSFYRGFW